MGNCQGRDQGEGRPSMMRHQRQVHHVGQPPTRKQIPFLNVSMRAGARGFLSHSISVRSGSAPRKDRPNDCGADVSGARRFVRVGQFSYGALVRLGWRSLAHALAIGSLPAMRRAELCIGTHPEPDRRAASRTATPQHAREPRSLAPMALATGGGTIFGVGVPSTNRTRTVSTANHPIFRGGYGRRMRNGYG